MRVGKMFLPKEFHINVKGMKRTGNFPEVFPSSDCCGRNPWWNGGVGVLALRRTSIHAYLLPSFPST